MYRLNSIWLPANHLDLHQDVGNFRNQELIFWCYKPQACGVLLTWCWAACSSRQYQDLKISVLMGQGRPESHKLQEQHCISWDSIASCTEGINFCFQSWVAIVSNWFQKFLSPPCLTAVALTSHSSLSLLWLTSTSNCSCDACWNYWWYHADSTCSLVLPWWYLQWWFAVAPCCYLVAWHLARSQNC